LSKQNGGYGSTINAALTIAKGKYFKLLDGDDWYDVETIPQFLDYLVTADSDVVLTPYYEIYENQNDYHCIDNHSSIPCRDTMIEQADFENDIQMHEIAVKTSVLRDNRVNISEHCFYTDVEFVFFSILYSQRVSRYPKAVYCYRLGIEGQSVSLQGIRKHYTDLLQVVDKMYREFHLHHDELESVKLHVLENKVERITHNVYVAYLLLENTNTARDNLIDFDKKLYERYREIYELSMKSKTIRCLRILNFKFYKMFCRFVLKKYCT
jgi:glycosyltransferase involved in cell wall biosynthesis